MVLLGDGRGMGGGMDAMADTGSDVVDPTGAFPAVATTDEQTWLAWTARLPLLDRIPASLVVVAPHPDDETFACGGLIAEVARTGGEVRVLTITGGEGSHPGVDGLVDLRRTEQDDALAALGVTTPPVRLDLPDAGVHHHVEEVAEHIGALAEGIDAVLAPWAHDGHTDHDACGRAALEAVRSPTTRLLAFPVWAWQWAVPADLEDLGLRRWSMPGAAWQAKQAAIDAYPSQTTGRLGHRIIDDVMLARFGRNHEVYADVG